MMTSTSRTREPTISIGLEAPMAMRVGSINGEVIGT